MAHGPSTPRPLSHPSTQVLCAPLFSVTLLDTVVADMLTSLVKVLLDLLWSAFYFLSGDFLRYDRTIA